MYHYEQLLFADNVLNVWLLYTQMYIHMHTFEAKEPVSDNWPLEHVSLYTFKTLVLNSDSYSCPVVFTHWAITQDFQPPNNYFKWEHHARIAFPKTCSLGCVH